VSLKEVDDSASLAPLDLNLWPSNLSLPTPTPLCLWKVARQASHILLHHQIKKELLFLLWASGRFWGAALENSRDSLGRTEIKPNGKYKWRKKGRLESQPGEEQA
jgi:hypothetical protein